MSSTSLSLIVFNSFLVFIFVFISNVFCTLVVNLDEMFIVYYFYWFVFFQYLLSCLMMNKVV